MDTAGSFTAGQRYQEPTKGSAHEPPLDASQAPSIGKAYGTRPVLLQDQPTAVDHVGGQNSCLQPLCAFCGPRWLAQCYGEEQQRLQLLQRGHWIEWRSPQNENDQPCIVHVRVLEEHIHFITLWILPMK
ncbi:unnamed protein product [Zymoseptoria tritici ST99CH_1A5]|uniref:Uncharacterized protein n=3 Tax=Zymoseptoria tritici TaxID=1047171 RepID=A0A1X7RHH8_ZYMT9|nr:unnamed protein product [Zymoseptoria tritici ST99CH_3D7]SMR43241.1 unnamed protein product [Zymoseptoria tritici ST99CH_1E4]SMY20561.1 unnamed protein product [Zymoseptoria tritici ST99CH_1A5]